MVTINQVRIWLGQLIIVTDRTEVVGLYMHRELSIPNEVHERLLRLLLLIFFFFVFLARVSLRIKICLVFLLKVDQVWTGEDVVKFDDKLSDNLVLFIFHHVIKTPITRHFAVL